MAGRSLGCRLPPAQGGPGVQGAAGAQHHRHLVLAAGAVVVEAHRGPQLGAVCGTPRQRAVGMAGGHPWDQAPHPTGTHRHRAGHGRGSACCAGCRGGGRRPGGAERRGQGRMCPHPASACPCCTGREGLGSCRGGRRTSMHRQGTRNSYGREMWRPPGTSTCGHRGSVSCGGGAWWAARGGDNRSHYLPVEGPGQLLALQGQLVAQPHHQGRALGHPHLDGPRLGDPGVGEDGPCGAGGGGQPVPVSPRTPPRDPSQPHRAARRRPGGCG